MQDRRPFTISPELALEVEQGLEQLPGHIVNATPKSRLPLLTTRENTHGSFSDNARVSQALKRSFRNEPGWEILTDVEKESMDMIALKFSRILSGKSMSKQHWEDVVGYAKLVEEKCE